MDTATGGLVARPVALDIFADTSIVHCRAAALQVPHCLVDPVVAIVVVAAAVVHRVSVHPAEVVAAVAGDTDPVHHSAANTAIDRATSCSAKWKVETWLLFLILFYYIIIRRL